MAEIYNTDRFAELYTKSQTPRMEDLGRAAKHVADLFRANNIPAAFLGGWALYLRGSGRSTNDIDMAVRDTMDHLMQLLSSQPSLSVPERYGTTCVQIFVHTAPTPVSVVIILGGHLGAPVNLPAGTETVVPIPTEQGTDAVQVIDLHHQLAAKLSAFYGRKAVNDYTDIEYLLATYNGAVYNLSGGLDLQHRQSFLDTYAGANATEPTWGDYIRQLLKL